MSSTTAEVVDIFDIEAIDASDHDTTKVTHTSSVVESVDGS